MTPDDLTQYFKYELTRVPTALFTDDGLRKTNKSSLSKELRKSLETTNPIDLPNEFAIDGGCLLYRVVWLETGTYLDIVNHYLKYVERHFGKQTTIVFDGYGSGPSVKDHEHIRRVTQASPDIDVSEHIPVYKKPKRFPNELVCLHH